MKIIIATPLYPPDVAEPAPYIKELVTRLSPTHEITVVLYGKLPEEVLGVSYSAVDKQQHLLKRLLLFTRTLIRHARKADVVYVENGASVELPALLARLMTRKPIVFHLGDERATTYATRHILFGLLTRTVRRMAHATLASKPDTRPEILPFAPYPTDALHAYDASWEKHLADVHAALSV